MPYSNMPESEWANMDKCVSEVEAQGHDKPSAIAICHTSIMGKKTVDEAIQMLKDGKIDIEAITSQKSGARHSVEDRKAIREVRTKAKEIHDLSIQLEASDSDEPAAKSAWQGEVYNILTLEAGAVKAAGDFALDVLGIPFGGPLKGKDTDGQFFSEKTNLHLDLMPEIPVYYYHGRDPNGKPMGEPVIIGMAKFDHKDVKGYWFKTILSKGLDLAKRVWEAAKNGIARASSDSASQYVRFNQATGEITNWPLIGLSVFDADGKRQPANAYAVAMPAAKMMFENAGMIMPVYPEEQEPQAPAEVPQEQSGANAQASIGTKSTNVKQGEIAMDEKELIALLDKRDADKAAEAKVAADNQAKIDEAVKAEKVKWEAEAARSRRLPGGGGAPHVTQFDQVSKYNHLTAADQAVLMGVLKSANKPFGPEAYQALAIKLAEDKTSVGDEGRSAMKMAGIKVDAIKDHEIDYSTYGSYGDEWVGIAYSTSLWEAIRVGTFVLDKLPQVEIPQGFESMYLPLESTDPVFYKVAEVTAVDGTMHNPVASISAPLAGTGRVLLTLAKLGARVLWTGELDEGSLIPFASQMRAQLEKSGAEYLEAAIIDGDTALTTANINEAGGSIVGTEYFNVWDGFRKSALVTTAANSRSAGGSLDISDFPATMQLMGTAGINALDVTRCGFIVGPNTYFKALQLPEVLTRDSFASPTIEGGKLTSLFGYSLDVSANMHHRAANRKSEATGYVDYTNQTHNAYGAILAVRWDQWKFGWRRHMTIETTRFANADVNEIVALLRCGLIQRDTEACAETYYVGV